MAKEKPIEEVLGDFGDPVDTPESKLIQKQRCITTKVQIMLQIKKDVLAFYTETAKREDESRNKSICKVLEEYARYEMEQVK